MKLKTVVNTKLNSKNLNLFLKKNCVSLNLQLLKSEICGKSFFCKNSLFLMEERFIQLKTILIVIYSYHYFNKTILFIGIPNKIISVLAKMKHFHVFLPSNIKLNGTLVNKNSVKMYLGYKQSKKTKPFLAVKKLPKLVVLLNPIKRLSVVSEIYLLRIPVIILHINKTSIERFSYRIFTSSTQLNLNSIFLSLLNCLFVKKRPFFNV